MQEFREKVLDLVNHVLHHPPGSGREWSELFAPSRVTD
jgi:hypothetical protein